MRTRILFLIAIFCSTLAGHIVFAGEASSPGTIEPRAEQALRQWVYYQAQYQGNDLVYVEVAAPR
jgi:hypothetical protein